MRNSGLANTEQEELSEEDQTLKSELEMLVARLHVRFLEDSRMIGKTNLRG